MRAKNELNEKIDLICIDVVRFSALLIALLLVVKFDKGDFMLTRFCITINIAPKDKWR